MAERETVTISPLQRRRDVYEADVLRIEEDVGMRELEGHTILIVESEIGPFVLELQRVLERAGAETLIARDVPAALSRNRGFEFTAAAVNVEYAALKEGLVIPTLVYGTDEVERSPEVILMHLSRLLAKDQAGGAQSCGEDG